MKRLTVPALLIAAVEAFADFRDPALDPMGASSDWNSSPPTYSSTERYFGGEAPAVVVPISPGTGPSYISDSQVMTDHQYCSRSVVSGAMVCQSH